MATRTSVNTSAIPGIDENGPRKVSTKMIMGPILRRPALGDVGNRPSLTVRPKVPPKPGMRKVSPTKKASLVKPKSRPVSSKDEDKENQAREPTENVEEEMEIQVEVEELAVAFSTQLLDVEDIDSQDRDNPQLVSEYVNDIYKHLRHLEDKNKVRNKYLEGQVINGKMRAILIDWLVQVHIRFTLLQETLYLTVAIIDRFLQSERNIPRTKLQLVGVTSMFIASKYEEMYCPEVGDFSYITDKAYSKKEIIKMEVKILTTLQFNISYPLPLHFLRRNSKAGSVDASQHTLAKYLLELCLPAYSLAHYKPSILAAAALCLSLKLIGDHEWSNTLVFYSHYTEEQLLSVMVKIAVVVVKSTSCKQQAVKQKYKASKFMKISDIPQLKSKIVLNLAEKGSPT